MTYQPTGFINGLDLCEAFYRDAVEPILKQEFPSLPYAAVLIGDGSEVLGYDTEMSSDHHWGPRVMLFVSAADKAKFKTNITKVLSEKLPRSFSGYPTGYLASEAADDKANDIQMLDYGEDGPINHRVEIFTTKEFIDGYLGFDINKEITAVDWLTFPEQKLLSITSGQIFHDEILLTQTINKFAYYPHDIWLYLLASAWSSIEQEEHLMGRAGDVGDEIGSAIIAARLVQNMMRLCFLMEKRYAPYPKWFGKAFQTLPMANTLAQILQMVLSARTWKERESHLSMAYECVAKLHNKLNITEPMPTAVAPFHGRPYLVISMGVFSNAIRARITEPDLMALAMKPLIGNIDQISGSTDLKADPAWREALLRIFGAH